MRHAVRRGTASRSGCQKDVNGTIHRQAGMIALDALDSVFEVSPARRAIGKALHGAPRLGELARVNCPHHLKGGSMTETNPHRLHKSLLVCPGLRGSCRRGARKRGPGFLHGLLREAKSACTGSMTERFYHAWRACVLDSSRNVARERALERCSPTGKAATRQNMRALERLRLRLPSERNITGRIAQQAETAPASKAMRGPRSARCAGATRRWRRPRGWRSRPRRRRWRDPSARRR